MRRASRIVGTRTGSRRDDQEIEKGIRRNVPVEIGTAARGVESERGCGEELTRHKVPFPARAVRKSDPRAARNIFETARDGRKKKAPGETNVSRGEVYWGIRNRSVLLHLKRERCHPKATQRAYLSHEETPVRLGSDRGFALGLLSRAREGFPPFSWHALGPRDSHGHPRF